MDSGEASSASASWSWAVCLFISGIFFGTLISGMLLYWKSSLERKLRALLGYPPSSHQSPPDHQDTDFDLPMDSDIIQDSPLDQEDTASTHSWDSESMQRRSSSGGVYRYDVFLSFRSTEPCYTFIDHLYHHLITKGISTFKPDEGLEIGVPISSQLLQAIKDSRVSIVVFSRDYASSTWCLDEMVAIVDCLNELGQGVFPVFYDVDPSDVRFQRGAYGDAFVIYTKKFKEDPQKVDRWKRAMICLANLAGFLVADSPEFGEIERIVQKVLDKLEFSRSTDLVGIQLPKDSKVIKDSPFGQEDPVSTHPLYSESIQSISSPRRVYKYDVFLSFRGTDTRNNFIDHLYHLLINKGISTFKDEEGFGTGEPISLRLLQVIKDSHISIIVFSKGYASSAWCLDEMVAIVECQRELKQVVFPVFYDVHPSDLRHQTGAYKDAFVLHTERFRKDPDKVDRWKSAMTHLANLAGFIVGDSPKFTKIERIVQEVSNILDPPYSKSLQSGPSSQRVYKYDVFVSFRGADTRNKFTNHLCNCLIRQGVSIFKNDKRLEEGEPIQSLLLQAIKDSRISIVVFTRDYANSAWCLEEMATIVDCHQELKQFVIPIFYDVDPSDVRKQTGAYRNVFVSLEKQFRQDPSKVRRWKKALNYLGNVSGPAVRNEPEFTYIEKIIQTVMDRLGHKFSWSSDYLVGIQPRVEYLEKLLKLSSEDDDFRVLGICGMDGIGKTTHALVLYDRIFDQFDAACFIENVSQIYRDSGAIAIQKQILYQTLNEQIPEIYSSFEISGFIRKKLSPKRVLIVLDDVDEIEQLEKLGINPKLLGRGSRIIITSRDEGILKLYGADEIHKVPLLNDNEAHDLFLKAFNSDSPSNNSCVELIPEILKYAQGLPLAIRVMGSSLRNRDATQWNDDLVRLRKNPGKNIMDILQTSFEDLRPNEKEIFLHIACFFHGEREEYVKRILDSCGLYSHIGIRVIMEKSLITIKDKKIHMHEMLQEFGRNIVRGIYTEEPALWSRLWVYKDFENALMSKTDTNNVTAIVLDHNEDVSKGNQLRVERLSKMRDLKLLILYHENFSGKLEHLSNNLRYLLWHGYPFSTLPLFEPYSHLVELNMPKSSIEQLWEGRKKFPYLEKADLSNSKNLMKTPNFEGSPSLRRLDLTGCTNLRLVDPSMGLLTELVYLSLQGCASLVNFDLGPECKLSSLKVLRLSGCKLLKKTPNFTGLSNLKYLDLEQCTSLLTVHESIGALSTLFLSLRGCTSLVEIPNNVNNMTSLQTLDLSGCTQLKNLPLGQRVMSSSFSYLKSLISLDLGFCELKGIPDAIGELRCLERLNLERSYFSYVPDTIERRRLSYLNLERLPELPFGLHQGEGISKRYPHPVIIGQGLRKGT